MAAHRSPGRGSDSDSLRRNTNSGSSPRGYSKGFFTVSTFSVDSLTVSVQPMCAISNTHQHIICALVKNPSHSPSLIGLIAAVDVKQQKQKQKIGAAELRSCGGRQSKWPSWAPVPNKPTVSVDVKQHSTN